MLPFARRWGGLRHLDDRSDASGDGAHAAGVEALRLHGIRLAEVRVNVNTRGDDEFARRIDDLIRFELAGVHHHGGNALPLDDEVSAYCAILQAKHATLDHRSSCHCRPLSNPTRHRKSERRERKKSQPRT